MRILLVVILTNCAALLSNAAEYTHGVMNIGCGSNITQVEYRVSVEKAHSSTKKFAMLIDGSPATKFFSDNNNNYLKITQALWQQGYKVFEIRYAERKIGAEGFYAACLQQGLPSIINHAGEIYDNAIRILGYDAHDKNHKLVALGYSIGAVLLQNMAFSKNKKFDNIALTGVLLGDAEKGCREGIKYLAALLQARQVSTTNFFTNNKLFDGWNWASFMPLVQKISVSGEGCCLENSVGFGSCKPGIKNEYTSEYNFEKQPFYMNSNLAMFEGTQTYPPDILAHFSSGNPAQVNYIARHRLQAGSLTHSYFYEHCDHSVINCSGEQGLKDFINFLTSDFGPREAN